MVGRVCDNCCDPVFDDRATDTVNGISNVTVHPVTGAERNFPTLPGCRDMFGDLQMSIDLDLYYVLLAKCKVKSLEVQLHAKHNVATVPGLTCMRVLNVAYGMSEFSSFMPEIMASVDMAQDAKTPLEHAIMIERTMANLSICYALADHSGLDGVATLVCMTFSSAARYGIKEDMKAAADANVRW